MIANLVSHVKEFPTECLEYLVDQARKGELFAEPMKFLACSFTILAFAANWITELADDEPVIGDPCGESFEALATEYCEVAGVEIPAGGFITNILVAKLVEAIIRQLIEMLDGSDLPSEAIELFKKYVEQFAEFFTKNL